MAGNVLCLLVSCVGLWSVIMAFPGHSCTYVLFVIYIFLIYSIQQLFSLALISFRKRELVTLLELFSCYHMSVPHSAVCWSVVCDCSWSYILFSVFELLNRI